MTNLDEDTKARLNGCGWTALFLVIVLGLASGVIYTLFMVGSWIGGQ